MLPVETVPGIRGEKIKCMLVISATWGSTNEITVQDNWI
jgi:hypothetical protein